MGSSDKNICIFWNLLKTKMYDFMHFYTIVTLLLKEGSSIINSFLEELLIEQTLENLTCKANVIFPLFLIPGGNSIPSLCILTTMHMHTS